MIRDERACLLQPIGVVGKLVQLDQQTLAQIARSDSGRIELLDTFEHRNDFVFFDFVLGGKSGQDLLERRDQHAVVVDAVDDRARDCEIALRHRRQVQLPQQVILQRLFSSVAFGSVEVVVRTRLGRRRRLKDVVPRTVDRQLFRHLFGERVAVAGQLAKLFIRCRRSVSSSSPFDASAAAFVVIVFDEFEHRIRFDGLLNLQAQIERRQLQQADRLLQLRRHRQLLAELERERLFHTD